MNIILKEVVKMVIIVKAYFCGLTNFQESQISQLKHNDIITNPNVNLKSE